MGFILFYHHIYTTKKFGWPSQSVCPSLNFSLWSWELSYKGKCENNRVNFFQNPSSLFIERDSTQLSSICICKKSSSVKNVSNNNYLNDPVLWWPASLPLEHCINTGCHCHGDWLHTFLCHVPLLGIFMNLIMIQSSEWNIRGKNNFRAVFLKWVNTNIYERKL